MSNRVHDFPTYAKPQKLKRAPKRKYMFIYIYIYTVLYIILHLWPLYHETRESAEQSQTRLSGYVYTLPIFYHVNHVQVNARNA
jgi:hypothetical protein